MNIRMVEPGGLVLLLLHMYYDLTLSVSATLNVTMNQFSMDISEINVVLEEWADSDDVLRQSMVKKMRVKYDKYWGRWHEEVENENDKGKGKGKKKEEENVNMFVFAAAVLDPRFKLLNFTKLAIEEMYGDINVDKSWEAVKTFVYALFEDYKSKYYPSDASKHLGAPSPQSEPAQKREGRKLVPRINKKLRAAGGGETSMSKSELEKYLHEENEVNRDDFDTLKWWKNNAARFPILARMAHDVLAILVSTVASESEFSTSGRIVNDFRTSLTPMLQALVCTQDWLKVSITLDIEDEEELLILEKGKDEEKGLCYYPLPYSCFKVSPCSSYRESHVMTFSYASRNHFSLLKTWLVYSDDGHANARGLHEQAS